MTIKNKFNIGQYVYFVHDDEQKKRQIIGILVTQNGLEYKVRCGDSGNDTFASEIELSTQRDVFGFNVPE